MSMRRRLRKFFWSILVFVLALFIIFQEWIWNSVKPILEYFSRFRIIQKIEAWICTLGPYPSIALFLVPFSATHIIEFWALGLTATGHVYLGFIIYGVSKFGGFMVLTRIFTLTRPKLMTVAWFKSSYDWFIEKKDLLHEKLEEMGVWKKIKKARLVLKLKYRSLRLKILGSKRGFFARAFARAKVKAQENNPGV